MGAYLMVYHKDCDHSLHMAISYDGYVWTALNNDRPVICGDTIAEQHGIRDPHIFRGPDGGFYLAMTDLHIFGSKEAAEREGHKNTKIYRNTEWERDGATYGWGNNRGLVLMKSFDLINWTRTNLDFSKLPPQPGQDWSEVGCVWAPETVYDEEKGQLLVHFTTRVRKEQGAIYCVYMNNDFTQMIGRPQLLFEAPQRKYTVIDSDIIKVGNTYHLFFVSHEKGATPVHATSKCITGPYEIDTLYNDNEKGGHEAPNCWKRIGDRKYVLMFDNYSMRPHNFGFVETTDFHTFTPIGHFDEEGSPMKRTNFSEQKHGAVIWITKEEAQRLEKRFLTNQFCIAKDGHAANIVIDENDWKSVIRAARDLGDDIRKVTGTANEVTTQTSSILPLTSNIVVGTIGKSQLIDKLIKQKKLDVSKVRGQWESYVIDVVDGNLVVAGSDKRGTIYGVYEISQRIGVSPWYWWADVPVKHQDEVYWDAGRFVSQEPTVKYRGIFINDEDWGLKPWSSTNYEKVLGDIGPKTYARVCELLLRLKANMLAPAMHSCTGAFYSHPENKVVADSFGIIITTSHCEPLLLNNAAKSEWDGDRDGDWNYKTNRDVIWKKWDDRLSEASQYENIYTVAMRGVHDAGLRGNLPMEERVPLIEQVIKEQRDLLVKHHAYSPSFKGKAATDIPQIFVPYKETMDIYENGLQVPDDITLVWVDDNYGYMKRVANPEEQKRSGRSGVYYHISYLGAPHDYLWINTTPPVLMYEELKKAYDAGADRYWLLNVGDIKPMELGIQTFMDMAWNINAFNFDNVNRHQARFLAKIFGIQYENDFQQMLDEYYRLAWSRKPEFMGWEYEWDDKAHTGLRPTEFSFYHYDDAQQRLADYKRISDKVEKLNNGSAAYYELVQFPIQGAYQMNRKFLMAQLSNQQLNYGEPARAHWAALEMEAAYDSINTLNRRYNEQLDGKWRGMMNLAPAFCSLSHLKPEVSDLSWAGIEPINLAPKHEVLQGCCVIDLAKYDSKTDDARLIRGLGYDWEVVQLGNPSSPITNPASSITYSFPEVSRDTIEVTLYTVPFWPIYAGKSNAIAISVDDGEPQVFENKFKEYGRSWKDQVMRNGAVCHIRFRVDTSKPSHTIRFKALDTGQMLQRVIIDWGGLKPSYVGPSLE